jgi:hypothetical protein
MSEKIMRSKKLFLHKNISGANIIKSLTTNEIRIIPGSMIAIRRMTMIGFAAKTIIEKMCGEDNKTAGTNKAIS